ncbi:unnamed protein product [Vitrella brassicaformis CCMP3155]|uniref:Uncharacterized protein n=1 Tax=Vitrella brassicaformis (strain CCMP3155) TaxID=1169540 RepID=A0A0G4GMP7_VITBC|nr:unnamed protein product [Vitrella brassicaformis CCMP3155]|eukprot:CEM31469.1 unnamed protein product [Vitrella brassicaformis CCMP3155]
MIGWKRENGLTVMSQVAIGLVPLSSIHVQREPTHAPHAQRTVAVDLAESLLICTSLGLSHATKPSLFGAGSSIRYTKIPPRLDSRTRRNE